MAVTTVHADNKVTRWVKDYWNEYVRDSRFRRYMGPTINAPIQVKIDLTKMRGEKLSLPLITRLQNSGVTGDNQLVDNEESLANYADSCDVDQLRHGVVVGEMEQQKTVLDLYQAAKPALKNWSMENLRDTIIARALSPNVDGLTAYASTSEANKDIWLAANDDRILFGAAKSNNSGNDHSASLLNVDSTSDTLSRAIVSLAKRMCKKADPHIRPIKVRDEEENYILFVPSEAFRDLKDDMGTTLKDAEVRGRKNPLFTDTDLYYDGVIIREVPEISTLSGVGNGGIDVAPCFMMGAQAMWIAWAKKTEFRKRKEDDYGNLMGVGIREIREVKKSFFNSVQHGMLTLYVSGVADT